MRSRCPQSPWPVSPQRIGGFRPVVRRIRSGNITIPRRIYRRIRLVGVGIGFTLLFCFEMISTGAISISLWWLIALTGVLVQGIYKPITAAAPGLRARDPTEEEHSRIKRCYEKFGRSPPPIFVSTNDNMYRDAEIGGWGDRRSLFVNESFLESATDETLAVILAYADERYRNHCSLVYYWTGALMVGALPLLIHAMYTLYSGSSISFFVGTLLGVCGLFLPRKVRQGIHKADLWVSEQFGSETVCEVYEGFDTNPRLIAIEEIEVPLIGSLLRFLVPSPSIERRIERLGDVTAGDSQSDLDNREQPAN